MGLIINSKFKVTISNMRVTKITTQTAGFILRIRIVSFSVTTTVDHLRYKIELIGIFIINLYLII